MPHPAAFWPGLAALAGAVALLVGALALVETWQAKMRLLRVPPLLLAGVAVALLGLLGHVAGGAW
jgi:hypothetical protein